MVDQLDLGAGRVGEVGHAAVGRPPTQKKASILLSLIALTDSATPSRSRFMSLSLSRPAASIMRNAITSVALPGEPVDTRLPFRSAILADAAALDGDHVHAVRIQHRQGPERHLVALELVFAAIGLEAGVGHREADVGLAAADQLEVVDRAAGDLGRRLHAGHVLRQHRGDAAAHRVIDAAGAAGGDRDVLRRCAERKQQTDQEQVKRLAELHWSSSVRTNPQRTR